MKRENLQVSTLFQLTKKGMAKPAHPQWLRLGIFIAFIVLTIIGTVIFKEEIGSYLEDLEKFGYIGIFLVALITNATVLAPAPFMVLTFPLIVGLANQTDPFSVAVVYAGGATLGETVSYILGRMGRKVVILNNDEFRLSQLVNWFQRWKFWHFLTKIGNKLKNWLGKYRIAKRMRNWLEKHQSEVTITSLAFQPILPFDVVGIVAGTLKYPFWKFFIFCFLGRVPKYIIWIGLGIEVEKLVPW